jgi:hypothetical protein
VPWNPRNSGSGKAEFTFDTDQGTVCYEIEVEGIAEPVEPPRGGVGPHPLPGHRGDRG